MNTVTVSTSRFEFSHGRKPRGYGMWCFEIGREVHSFHGLYSEALTAAKRCARELGAGSITVFP